MKYLNFDMIQLIMLLLLIATLMIFWGQLYDAQIMIAPIVGVVFGALWSRQNFEEEEIVEYTLQCCIFFISLTIVWERPLNG